MPFPNQPLQTTRGEQVLRYATRYSRLQSRSAILFKLSGTSVFIPTPESIGSVLMTST